MKLLYKATKDELDSILEQLKEKLFITDDSIKISSKSSIIYSEEWKVAICARNKRGVRSYFFMPITPLPDEVFSMLALINV